MLLQLAPAGEGPPRNPVLALQVRLDWLPWMVAVLLAGHRALTLTIAIQ
jgi:hypothetical protein